MARILVVDDEAEIRELIRRVLMIDGHEVDMAAHGAAALAALAVRPYDLVICNVRMPVMDGPTLYAHILDRDPVQASRFLFCTGDILSVDVGSFLLAADQPVLMKPFTVAGLRETVRALLNGASASRQRREYPAQEPYAASRFPA
ncbi:MAG: response regulator [Anaerolineae bacterium]|nr:response regulator [Anaerolineae bacterium]